MEAGAELIDTLLANELALEEERLLDLASVLRRNGQREEAKDVYREVLELNPKNETARSALHRLGGEVTVVGVTPVVLSDQTSQSGLQPDEELDDVTSSIQLIEPRPQRQPRPRSESRIIREINAPVVHAPLEPAAKTADVAPALAEAAGVHRRPNLLQGLLGVLVVVVMTALVTLVWDTRQEMEALSQRLTARPPVTELAPDLATPQTFTLVFDAAESIEYRTSEAGVLTTQATPGQVLEPGDLVAEVMDSRDYDRLVNARSQFFSLRSKARRDAKYRGPARRAQRRALHYLVTGKRTQVRAAQTGVARPTTEGVAEVGDDEVVMLLEDPTELGADLPPTAKIDLDSTCRFGGEAAGEPCRLVFERSGTSSGRVRVLLDNDTGRFLPGQSLEVTID